MAEAAGLAVGVVALVGVFENCVRLLDYVSAAQSIKEDSEVLCVRLDIQKLRLLHWVERVGFLTPDCDPRSDDANVLAGIRRAMVALHGLLADSDRLRNKYGLGDTNIDTHRPLVLPSKSRTGDFVQRLRNLRLDEKARQPLIPKVRKVCWAIRDDKKFSSLVDDVTALLDGLCHLVPDCHNCLDQLCRDDTQRMSHRHLKLVVKAVNDPDDAMYQQASQALTKQAEDRVLERLWFRLMNDRRRSVHPAHAKTFEWALASPGSSGCELSRWLSSGSGIFWIQGKPASGKVCL
jgi:hypothetical protein